MKPILVTAPDGYILDIHGPYFADGRNNDASALISELQRDADGLQQWLQAGDIIICDRGYRDAVPVLEEIGINCKIPASIQRGENQLTTEEANETRLITKTRWIIEARNGHIKSIFKFFNHTISINHVVHIGDFYRIAGAIINKYKETISMNNATPAVARAMRAEAEMPNLVKTRVLQNNLQQIRGRWVHLNGNHIQDFPVLDLEYLRNLTLGVYQIGLAPSYIQDNFEIEGASVFEVDERNEEPGFLRCRISSRYRNAVKHQLWIMYIPVNCDQNVEDNIPERISAYYCTCKCGSRTLGCCSHVCSVLWYLGYARHNNNNINYPSCRLLECIMDAADRPINRISISSDINFN